MVKINTSATRQEIAALHVPKNCPVCFKALQWTKTKTDLYCANEGCTDHSKIEKFFAVLKTDLLGPGNVQAIISAGYDSVPAILKMSVKDFAKLPKFQEKKAKAVYKAIRAATGKVPLYLLMRASDIFNDAEVALGSTRLNKLVDAIGEKTILSSKKLNVNDVASIDMIGPGIAKLFVAKLEEYRRWHKEIETLIAVDSNKNIGRLTGKSFCWTGFRSPEQERYVIENGGEVKNSVTKNLTALFAASVGSGKATKAKVYGVPIILMDKAEEYLEKT